MIRTESMRIALSRHPAQQVAVVAHDARHADRRRLGHHAGGRWHRVVAEDAEADRGSRHEPAADQQAGRFRRLRRPRNDRHPVESGEPDRRRRHGSRRQDAEPRHRRRRSGHDGELGDRGVSGRVVLALLVRRHDSELRADQGLRRSRKARSSPPPTRPSTTGSRSSARPSRRISSALPTRSATTCSSTARATRSSGC